jgi:hypothetical protein
MESKHRVDLVRDYMNAELETGARVPTYAAGSVRASDVRHSALTDR